jgi:hypothetical protein
MFQVWNATWELAEEEFGETAVGTGGEKVEFSSISFL